MNRHNTETMRELLEKIERLEAENRDLREVLSFYAKNMGLSIDHRTNVFMSHDCDDAKDFHGHRAREVLAKWGKK
jgi:hypothetical protein